MITGRIEPKSTFLKLFSSLHPQIEGEQRKKFGKVIEHISPIIALLESLTILCIRDSSGRLFSYDVIYQIDHKTQQPSARVTIHYGSGIDFVVRYEHSIYSLVKYNRLEFGDGSIFPELAIHDFETYCKSSMELFTKRIRLYCAIATVPNLKNNNLWEHSS